MKLIVVALQKMNTARIGIAPDFQRYVVNVPSNMVQIVPPKNVLIIAPNSNGTTIKPPGIFFTLFRMFILVSPLC